MDSFDTFSDWLKKHHFESYFGKALYELTDEEFHESMLVQCYEQLTGHSDTDQIVYSQLIRPLEYLAANNKELLQKYLHGEIENLPALVSYVRAGFSYEDYLKDPVQYETELLKMSFEAGVPVQVLKRNSWLRAYQNVDELRLAYENLELLSDLKLRPYYLKLLTLGCKAEELKVLDSDFLVWACSHFFGSLEQTLVVWHLTHNLHCIVRSNPGAIADFVAYIWQDEEQFVVPVSQSIQAFTKSGLRNQVLFVAVVQNTMLVFQASEGCKNTFRIPFKYTLEESDESLLEVLDTVDHLSISTRMAIVSLADKDELWKAVGVFKEYYAQKILNHWELGFATNAIVAAYSMIKIKDKIEPVIVIDGEEVNVFECVPSESLYTKIKGSAKWRVEHETLYVFNS